MKSPKGLLIIVGLILLSILTPVIGYEMTVGHKDVDINSYGNMVTFTKLWEYDCSQQQSGALGPLIADINNDGKMEILVAGDNTPDPDFLFVLKNDGTLLWKKQLFFSTVGHNPLETFDLDGDGKLEIIVPSPNGMQVIKSDGTEYWKNSAVTSSESHVIVVKVDGYPYIYASNANSNTGGIIKKVDGKTGAIVKQVQGWYPCHGGFTAGIINGKLKLYLSDRNFGTGAKGLRCYDTDLNLIWNRADIACSSHLPLLYDINKDGKLEVIISQQRDTNAGLYCLNTETGANIPGKCQDTITGLCVHESMTIGDIKGDGNPRLITSCYSPAKVFNIGTWQFEATLNNNGKGGGNIARVVDDKWNILLTDEVSQIRIYDNNYVLIGSIPEACYGATIQDINADGKNEIVMVSPLGVVKAYATNGQAITPLPNTGTCFYSNQRCRTAIYVPETPVNRVILSIKINIYNPDLVPIYNDEIDITDV